VIADSGSHHGTYINDSLSSLTPGQAYKLQGRAAFMRSSCLLTFADQDTVSFGKGIFKDGSFHPPHTVLIRMNAADESSPSPTKPRTPTSVALASLLSYIRLHSVSNTYGLKSQRTEQPSHLTPGEGSQSEVQASKIRVRHHSPCPLTSLITPMID
jgi:hypothetical protein